MKSNNDKITHYRIFDTCSDSKMYVEEEAMMSILLNYGNQVVNARLQNNNILVEDYVQSNYKEGHNYTTRFSTKFSGPKSMLLGQDGHRFKIVNSLGTETIITSKQLLKYIGEGELVNCRIHISDNYKILKVLKDICGNQKLKYSIIDAESTKIRAFGTYSMQKNARFEEIIHQKYEKFTAKALLLNHASMSFDYEIEGQEVRLQKYTGSSKNVILPSFITAIRPRAFHSSSIKTIRLNEGLKVIAEEAFVLNQLAEVEIPSTVELADEGAFGFNRELYLRGSNKLDMTKFNLLSDKTMLV